MRKGFEVSDISANISYSIAIKGHCHEFFSQVPELFEHQTPPGQELREVLVNLGIKPELIMGVIVNGKSQKKDYKPVSGDRIILLSPPTGG